MGENEDMGWFPRYIGGQPMCNDVGYTTQVWNGSQPPSDIDYIGIDTSGNPIYKPKTSCGTIPKPSPSHAERMASLKAEVDALAKEYEPIVDKLIEEIYESSQKQIELLSEETAQRINKTFEDIRKTMDKDFPIVFTKRKARKYYKPKFTL